MSAARQVAGQFTEISMAFGVQHRWCLAGASTLPLRPVPIQLLRGQGHGPAP
jgi:hypothetical protein